MRSFRNGDFAAFLLYCIAAAVLTMPATALHAQSADSKKALSGDTIAVENVQFRADDVTVDAYLATPKSPGPHPAVIVIHDSRGLDDQARAMSRRFAEEGFVALAPDMLSSVGGTAKLKGADEIADASAAMPAFVSISELKAAVEYLTKNPAVDAVQISSVGIGWGGYRCFFLAIAESTLHRAVLFYGTAADAGLEMIKAPILAHYAKYDNRVTGNAPLIAEEMKARGKRFEYFVYDGADSGFLREDGPRYNAQSAELAWKRTLDFLRN